MSTELMIKQFQTGELVVKCFFQEDGYFNATQVAKVFGQKPDNWLVLDKTNKLVEAISRKMEIEQNQLVISRRGAPETGGGTWMHPRLAVHFAYWLDVDFSIWVGDQIDIILKSGLSDPMRDPFPVLVHPVYGFPVVSLLEDNAHKQVRNSYVETLNRLGLRAPIYKQTLTNNVSRILIGMPIKPFRRLFGIPAGSRARTRLLMDWNLRRAVSRIEETACFMINQDQNVHSFSHIEDVVYQVAKIVYQQHLSRGLTLGENVPEQLLEFNL